MKKRIHPFFAGMVTMALITSSIISAVAISSRISIEVDPINIQVNGTIFQPKDTTGADVPVFAYNGTTYAPLRALAEAYGLDVWYDSASNLAAVGPKGSAPATVPTASDSIPAGPVTLYAADGRTTEVEADQVEANIAVGWYTTYDEAAQHFAPFDANEIKLGDITVGSSYVNLDIFNGSGAAIQLDKTLHYSAYECQGFSDEGRTIPNIPGKLNVQIYQTKSRISTTDQQGGIGYVYFTVLTTGDKYKLSFVKAGVDNMDYTSHITKL